MHKKFIRTFVALLLVLTLAGTTAYAESATVLGDAVNLREGPGMNYRVLDTIPGGAVVEVTDTSNVAWYGVSYRGKSGYMSTGYLRVNYGGDSATVSYAEPYSFAAEGTAVIILEGTSPAAPESSAPAPVTVELPAAASQPTATTPTPAPSAAPAATYTPAISDPTVDAEVEEGTAVIILGSNTIYLPATQTAQPAETNTPAPADTSRVGKTGYINGDFVCFRSAASGTARILNTYNKGKELVITGAATGDWTPVRIDGAEGFVSTRYITLSEEYLASMASGSTPAPASSSTPAPTQTPTPTSSVSSGNAYITGNNVRFRSGPSMSSAIIGEFFYGNSVSVTGSTGDWTAVTYNGKSGYVYSQYVKTGSFQTSTPTQSGGTASSGSATGQQIVDYALQFVGYRYVWGGTSPETGFDCSGFTQYVYKHFGYQLNRVACDQAKNGVHVEKDALQPGDVLCFYSSADYIGHVGIYIGNNRFVHASTSTTGVIISELNGYYFTRGYEARRIV